MAHRLVIDPVTGDKILKLDDGSSQKTETGAPIKYTSLWDLLHGTFSFKAADGTVLRMLPITLETLAKVEELEQQNAEKPMLGYVYSIKFLAAVINDPAARGDKPPISEEDLARKLTSDMYRAMMELVKDHLNPSSVDRAMPVPESTTATGGPASSAS